MPVESILKKRKRLAYVVSHLKEEYPNSKCSLHYKTSFQLLVATILSAQCTDERVNKVTQNMFSKYSEPADFATLSLEVIKKEIYSTGFYNNKSKMLTIIGYLHQVAAPDVKCYKDYGCHMVIGRNELMKNLNTILKKIFHAD